MNSKYKEITDRAFRCHQKGNLEQAEMIYRRLLEINPDDANVLNLIGLLMLEKGEINEAVDFLTNAFLIDRSAVTANNLGKAYYNADMPDKAVKLFLEALKIEEDDDTYYSLGLAYKKTGDIKNAIEAYKNALELNPQNYAACFNLALAFNACGNTENAIIYAEKCTALNDKDEHLFGALSGFYEKKGNYAAAVNALKKAIEINPNRYLYYYNAAVLSGMINNKDEAVYYYLKSISINPNNIESYVNLANIIKEQDSEKAIEYLIKAYELNPKEEILLLSLAQIYKDVCKNEESIKILKELLYSNPLCSSAYAIMAMNYMDLCQYDKALQNYELALKLDSENLDFLHGKAVALKYSGKIDEARQILEDIIDKENCTTETKITLGMLYLQNKEFQKGLKLYRLRSDNIKNAQIKKGDIWEIGEKIEDKIILVYSNCGLGDSIMYSRYLPLLKEKAKNVILQTDKDIVNIMRNSFPDIKIISKTNKMPKYDKVLQFMDIQAALNLDFNNIPSPEGYLKADENLVKKYSQLPLFNSGKKKIGLFWQGNKRIFKNRFVKFDIINRLTENKDYNFYSFQIDTSIKETDNFFDLSCYIKDYSDTAALLKNIDVLVTIDSSIAHMAGALGVKTYLLLPKTAEWRWFYDEKYTPWYKSIEIFKQVKSADWNEVIDRVMKIL